MGTNTSKYCYHLRTRAGSRTIELIFSENNTAEISDVSNWRGPVKGEYIFSCLHQPVSENHGFLRVIKIEDIQAGKEIYSEPLIDYGDDIYGLYLSLSAQDVADVEIVFEYIRLRQPELHFSGDRILDNMKFIGSAEWSETFSLFLFLLPLTNIPEDSEVQKIISGFDKIKLELADQE
ncbi:MAG TPA: hypothetical protein VMT12_02085 [Syntrophales bacterium]|nr:hypothetical protein [Syntrophales bacterium]